MPTLRELPRRGAKEAVPTPGSRSAWCFATRRMTRFAIWQRGEFARGDTVTGPGLVEEATSVTVVHTGQTLNVDRHGYLVISMAHQEAE